MKHEAALEINVTYTHLKRIAGGGFLLRGGKLDDG